MSRVRNLRFYQPRKPLQRLLPTQVAHLDRNRQAPFTMYGAVPHGTAFKPTATFIVPGNAQYAIAKRRQPRRCAAGHETRNRAASPGWQRLGAHWAP
jgi:hypothetical protein